MVYRVTVCPHEGLRIQLLGVERMFGRDRGSLHDTLKLVPGLTEPEIELLLEIARLMSDVEANSPPKTDAENKKVRIDRIVAARRRGVRAVASRRAVADRKAG